MATNCRKCSIPLDKEYLRTRGLCNRCDGQIRNLEFNNKLKQIVGETCWLCGYSGCWRALSFHHVDPSTKEYLISKLHKRIRSFEIAAIEIRKCVLVCSNCHAEIHAGVVSEQTVQNLYAKWWAKINRKLAKGE